MPPGRRPAVLLAVLVGLAACKSSARVPRGAPPIVHPSAISGDGDALAHTLLRVDDLPPPRVGRNDDYSPEYVPPPPGAALRLPEGFSIRPFAEGDFEEPRWLAVAPGGDVFLADSGAGIVWLLRPSGSAAPARFAFARGLRQPFGLAFREGWLYVGDTDAVLRFRYAPGQTTATGPGETIAELPGHGYNQHWTRNLIFSPDGHKLFVSVGSETNDDVDPPPRASLLVMNPDGSDRRVFASGMRNPVGLAFYPGTSRLWATVEERDHLGDDLVPDYLTEVRDGGFYGWPFAYSGPHEDPTHRGERPDLVAATIAPDVLFQAHSAVLGLVFYEGAAFPPEFKGDAFVAFHGSWNRSRRTGYKIVRVRFAGGRPVGGYDDFLTGWMLGEHDRRVWGRPVGLAVAKDGTLLVVDDAAKVVWQVQYTAPPPSAR